MNKITTIAGLVIAAGTMSASADNLLVIDLSVANTLTITSTGGNSSASATSSNFTGYLLAEFFNDASVTPADLSVSGNLTTNSNASDASADIFSGGSDFGLNVWSFSTDTNVSVTAGVQAFVGSTTWTVDAADYAAMLAGNTSGDIYFGADTDDDIAAGATLIGTWNVVPAPSGLALIGLGGIVAGRRRR